MKQLFILVIFSLLSIANPASAKGKTEQLFAAQSQQSGLEEAQIRVNINTADASQLAEALKGVGAKKAQAIIEYRKEFGDFKTANELTAVKGIGEKTVQKNLSKIAN